MLLEPDAFAQFFIENPVPGEGVELGADARFGEPPGDGEAIETTLFSALEGFGVDVRGEYGETLEDSLFLGSHGQGVRFLAC